MLTSNVNDYNPKRIKEEAEKLGVGADLVQYHDVQFRLKLNDTRITAKGIDVLSYDYLILRGTGAGNFDLSMQRDALVQYTLGEKIRVLNQDLFCNFAGKFDKLMQTIVLLKAGLPVIDSRAYGYFDQVREAEREFPVIVKKFVGSHGSGVKKAVSPRGLEYFCGAMLPWMVMFQPFLTTGSDYRVIVIGGKVLGAMKRTAQEGAYVTNVSAGGKFAAAEVTDELRDLAIRAAAAFKADYCGVDVMYDDQNKPYVLEVNKAAEFKGFESCTGLNVAGEMVGWLVKNNEQGTVNNKQWDNNDGEI